MRKKNAGWGGGMRRYISIDWARLHLIRRGDDVIALEIQSAASFDIHRRAFRHVFLFFRFTLAVQQFCVFFSVFFLLIFARFLSPSG